jgi:hypothetical protein
MERMSRSLIAVLGLLAALLAARAAGTDVHSRQRGEAEEALPPAWNTLSSHAFQAAFEARPALALSAEEGAALAAALDAADVETAVRAAVLLARAGARDALLARLEKRVAHEAQNGDAGDVVCAAALERSAPSEPADVRARLAALAVGEARHPDLEVRVECARGALSRGERAPVPFLLALLRAHTPARTPEREDWPPTDTLAWAKSRAAEALSATAGVPCTFRADAPYARQAEAAAALEEALR